MYFNVERTLFGIAAASALIFAACISGLPATSCTALAESYGRAVTSFGSVALVCLVLYALLQPAPDRGARKADRLELFFIFLAMTVFLLASVSSIQNLKRATFHCFVGTDAELTQRLHQRIRLAEPWDIPAWFDAPMWDN